MIKKLVSSLLVMAVVITIFPVSASAEWRNDSKGWWNTEGNSYSIGWRQINGSWYYFNENGYMVTGAVAINNKTYNFDSNGKWIESSNSTSVSSTSTAKSMKPSSEALKSASENSWFKENNNYYFKLTGADYAKDTWSIDVDTYYFDDNGVMQTGEVSDNSGVKYLFGSDGKYIKCLNRDNYRVYASNGATTGNYSPNKGALARAVSTDSKIKFNTDELSIWKVYSSDPAKAKTTVTGTAPNTKTVYNGASMKGNTLKCRTNETIQLSTLEVGNVNNWGTTPKLIVKVTSSNDDIAFCGFDLAYADGYVRLISPSIITKKAGKTTITIDVNGTTKSFDIVVTD
ncbi:cell wall-binding protein [Clostridium sp. C2-6-12]|uniref:cell wall-binding protein n=1 Tax=Clostridium sp. C2-6-12 TaxID=2698832 RepID=UPI00137089F7|nr:cell wall-binding protein [Clostridium sp. C2-6-12]